MEKTLYIHIGEPKTATSSIQTFLFKNQGLLKKKGILSPGFISDHHDVSNEILNNTLQEIQENRKSPAKKFMKKIQNSKYNTYILSSENFCRLWNNVSRLKALIPDNVNVKIIYYVRRQDDQTEAIYNQTVKSPLGRNWLIDEYVEGPAKNILNYERVLAQWEEAFGRENIIVRCFEEGQLKTDIYTDFLDAIGLGMDEKFVIPEKRINQRFDWDLIELIRLCKIHFEGDIEFYTFLHDYFEERNTPPLEKKHIISPDKRQEIIEYFEDSNRNVAVKYLGREDGRLFYYPLPGPDEPYIADLNMNSQSISPVIPEIIYDIYKKNNSFGKKMLRRFKKAKDRFSYFEIMKILYYKYLSY